MVLHVCCLWHDKASCVLSGGNAGDMRANQRAFLQHERGSLNICESRGFHLHRTHKHSEVL